MRIVETLVAALLVPLLVLSSVGGVVAFVWLAYLGQWNLILLGFSLLVLGYLVSLVLLVLPVGGLMLFSGKAFEKGASFVGYVVGFLSNVYAALFEMVWGVSVFLYLGQRSNETNGVPLWIMSFVVGTGIFTTLASKSYRLNPNPIQFVGAIVNQLAFILLSVAILSLGWSLTSALLAMAVLKLIPVLFSLRLLVEARRDLAWQKIGRY